MTEDQFLRPVIIAAPGRCGTSLTCAIFAAHGVWTGKCVSADDKNPLGYFENDRLKRAFQEREPAKMASLVPYDPAWKDVVRAALDADGYAGGQWLVKINPIAAPLWNDFSPIWILPRRSLGGMFASLRRAGFAGYLTDRELREALTFQSDVMDRLIDEGGVDVFPDELVTGNYQSIETALESAGITQDRKIIETTIKPHLWTTA